MSATDFLIDVLLENPAMYDFVMDGLREVCLAEGSHHIPSFLERFHQLRQQSRALTEQLAYAQEENYQIESSYEKAFDVTRRLFGEYASISPNMNQLFNTNPRH